MPSFRRFFNASVVTPQSNREPNEIRQRVRFDTTQNECHDLPVATIYPSENNNTTDPDNWDWKSIHKRAAKFKVATTTTVAHDVYDGLVHGVMSEEDDDDCSISSFCDIVDNSSSAKASPRTGHNKNPDNYGSGCNVAATCFCQIARLPCTCHRVEAETTTTLSRSQRDTQQLREVTAPANVVSDDVDIVIPYTDSKYDIVVTTTKAHEVFDSFVHDMSRDEDAMEDEFGI